MNPPVILKSTTMIIPTTSKVDITGKRTHSKATEIEEKDSEAPKRQKIEP